MEWGRQGGGEISRYIKCYILSYTTDAVFLDLLIWQYPNERMIAMIFLSCEALTEISCQKANWACPLSYEKQFFFKIKLYDILIAKSAAKW